MNKTLSIALAGFSFVIEEQAYIELKNYLQALRKALDKDAVEEIMYDIELRIVEIFKENLQKREVVNSDDVKKIIAQIGTPQEIEGGENHERNQNQGFFQTDKKHLFRDTENKILAGICSGLAHYLSVDATLMRVLWAVILVVTGFFPLVIIYLILWLLIPETKTTSDFLKMKGKPIDFNHIKQESVRFATESSKKVEEFYHQNKDKISKTGNGIWNTIRKILGTISFFVVLGLVVFMGMISLYFFGIGSFPVSYYSDFFLFSYEFSGVEKLDFLIDSQLKYWILGILGIFILILIVIFSALGIKCFWPKVKIRNTAYLVILLSMILVGSVIYLGVEMSQKQIFYASENYQEENISLPSGSKILELEVQNLSIPQNFKNYGQDIFSDKQKVFEKDRPEVYVIQKENITTPYLVIKKKGDGYNIPLRMGAEVRVKNHKILFPTHITYPYEDRLRNYDVVYELVVPTGIQVRDNSKGQIDLNDDNFMEMTPHLSTPEENPNTEIDSLNLYQN